MEKAERTVWLGGISLFRGEKIGSLQGWVCPREREGFFDENLFLVAFVKHVDLRLEPQQEWLLLSHHGEQDNRWQK